MMSSWQPLSIGDLGRVITGRTPPGARQDFFGDSVSFLTPTDMDGRRKVDKTARSLSTEGADLLYKVTVPHGVAVSCIGWQMGKAILVDRPTVTNQQINTIIPDTSRIRDLFLYYALTAKRLEIFALGAGGSRTPILNKTDFEKVMISVPPLSEQCAIAHILGTLDDKIELNRRMNETLEEMARAIFKSWFVDFEPVRAKAEGRDPGLPKHIADLFPDRFEDSELGETPAGWESWCVSDVGNVICGKTPSTKVAEYYGDAIPFITIPDMRGKVFAKNVQRKLSHLGAASQPKKALPAGALCVSCIATPGLVVIASEESHTNQQINTVVPENPDETYFWFWIFRNLGEQIASGGSGGSVFANLSTGRFSNMRVLAPCAELRRYYHMLVAPIFDQILRCDTEMNTLAAVRDALLPRLISGELRAPDAGRAVEAVVRDPAAR